jgi:alpha-beta hydrolase superfamily lysophospholipase
VPHAALAGPSVIDVTGAAAALAGLVCIVLAFCNALGGRSRLTQMAIALPVCALLLQFGVLPVVGAGLATNTRRPSIPSARSLGLAGARDVTFSARDGVRLAGWYAPGRSSSAVLLLHGSHDTRVSTLSHLRMLAGAGYGVLAFDARGHGQSRGETNALGWRGSDDIAGAFAFLAREPGVDAHRISLLGLSMGAEEGLRAAADGVPLAAVIADGAGASTLGDQRLLASGPTEPVFVASTWLGMRVTELLSGDDEPAPLAAIARRIRVPVLLIASSSAGERTLDYDFRRSIGARATLWYVPDARHTRALERHPDRYRARVLAFLASAVQR